MKKLVLTALALLSTGLLVATVGYGTAAADGHDGGRDSVEGHGSAFGSFRFHAHNDSDDPFDATGYFTGISPFGPSVRLQGKITCLDVDGDRAGFIYQIDRGSKPPFLFNTQEVKVSVKDGGTDRIGFSLPAPSGTYKNCHPGSAMSKVKNGGVEVRGGND